MSRHLLWLRADLRVIDNTALLAACADPAADIAAVYYLTPAQWRAHDVAGCRVDFELRTLRLLGDRLAALNIPLLVRTAPAFADVPADLLRLCREHHVSALYFNRQYEVNEQARDEAASELLERHGIACHAFHDQCLAPPGRVLTADRRYYSVFTPFKRNWLQWLADDGAAVQPAPARRARRWLEPSTIPERIEGFESHLTADIAQTHWPAGEDAALDRLGLFCDGPILDYQDRRNIPSRDDGTSRLSPYLAVGTLSPRQCRQAALNAQLDRGPNPGIDQWLGELAWRDFYKHLLVGFPRLSKHQPFQLETRALSWRQDDEAFQRWCAGKTGFPLVDAAMRQLHTLGWMHNRLRMVVAMFLTKDLFIDWRWGERYFMRHLIDGDLAANNGGWQWSASTGNDAAPYFRIFNPELQSRKFDPDGEFIRRYVPELAHLDNRTIHQPHGKQRQLWLDYPLPMIDHKAACARTVEAFRALKNHPDAMVD